MKVTERKNGHVQFIIGTKIIKKQSKSSRYFYTEEELQEFIDNNIINVVEAIKVVKMEIISL